MGDLFKMIGRTNIEQSQGGRGGLQTFTHRQTDRLSYTDRHTHRQKLTSAGDEAKGVVSRLHVLPEVHVGVIEDVRVQVEVVEALR